MDNNNPSVVARNLSLAIEKLDAEYVRGGSWSYYANEIKMTCFVTTAELVELGELLADLDLESRRNAYSLWCAKTPTRERIAD